MAKNDNTNADLLNEIAELKARLKALEAARVPAAPQVAKPADPPSWCAPQIPSGADYPYAPRVEDTLVHRGPAPIVNEHGHWRDPFGCWRDREGKIPSTAPPAPVIGPEHDPAVRDTIRLFDSAFPLQ